MSKFEDRPVVEKSMAHLDYATVKEHLVSTRGFPRDWIAAASAEELAQAAADLLVERDQKKLWHYLYLFSRRDFPLPPTDIFRLVRSQTMRIANGAELVLRRIAHPDVRALALDLLVEGYRPDIAIGLLRSNYQPGDLKNVNEALEKLVLDEDGWHGVGMSVLDVLGHFKVPLDECCSLLLRLYEEDPCSYCRNGVVEKLAEMGGVPDWMAEECQFDAEPDTAKVINGDRSNGVAGPSA